MHRAPTNHQPTALLRSSFLLIAFAHWLLYLNWTTFQHYGGFVIISHWCSTRVCGMFWSIWYPKKTFFADFPCILLICDYHACFGGCFGWNLAFQVLFTSLRWNFCFSITTSALGTKCFCQTTHLPLHIWFQGEFEQGMIAWALFPCCLMETNLSFTQLLLFF